MYKHSISNIFYFYFYITWCFLGSKNRHWIFLGLVVSPGIFTGLVRSPRDFLGFDFYLHSIIPVNWNPEYPPGTRISHYEKINFLGANIRQTKTTRKKSGAKMANTVFVPNLQEGNLGRSVIRANTYTWRQKPNTRSEQRPWIVSRRFYGPVYFKNDFGANWANLISPTDQ